MRVARSYRCLSVVKQGTFRVSSCIGCARRVTFDAIKPLLSSAGVGNKSSTRVQLTQSASLIRTGELASGAIAHSGTVAKQESWASKCDGGEDVVLEGVVAGFRGNGWPMVRLGKQAASVLLQEDSGRPATGQPVVPAVPPATTGGSSATPLMRGQRVRLGWQRCAAGDAGDPALKWSVLEVLQTHQRVKARCIHPTRVAGLCLNCPRRKDGAHRRRVRGVLTAAISHFQSQRFASCAKASDEETRWERGLEIIELIKVQDEDLAQELLTGADLNATDHFGSTSLILAARSGLFKLCCALLEEPTVDVNAQNHFGSTALICASTNGHIDVCERLLLHGADVNIRTRLGATALGKAAASGQMHVCERLIAAGATVDIRTKLGQSPSDLAQQAGHSDLAKKLADKGNSL